MYFIEHCLLGYTFELAVAIAKWYPDPSVAMYCIFVLHKFFVENMVHASLINLH